MSADKCIRLLIWCLYGIREREAHDSIFSLSIWPPILLLVSLVSFWCRHITIVELVALMVFIVYLLVIEVIKILISIKTLLMSRDI